MAYFKSRNPSALPPNGIKETGDMMNTKRTEKEAKFLGVMIDPSWHRQLRIRAAYNGETISELVRRQIEPIARPIEPQELETA